MQNSVKPEKLLFMIAAIAIVLGAMRVASGVLVPGLLALFIAIVCTEPMYWLTEKGLPRWLAILLVVIVLLGVSSTIPLVVSGSIVQFNQQLPIYQERLDELMFQSSGWLQQFGYTAESLQTIFDPSALLGYVQLVLGALGGILSSYLLIMLLVIFILVDVPRSLAAGASTSGQIIRTVQHYFAIKTFTSLLTGVIISVWCILMDVQYPFLWGFIAFLLNFIPTIGSVIAAIPAVLLALMFNGAVSALVVMLGYVIINFGISNGLEPRIMGQQLGIRFVWIFVSLVAWGWILGPVGMLLAVPLTMTFRIMFDNHDDTRWIANILVPETHRAELSKE
ncbi:MAG TPA: hypothetical protein DEQ32_01495 [Gammaproteobacteria bacterium]|nr:hypothetical protein [Gammaproteobacteria bacterium]